MVSLKVFDGRMTAAASAGSGLESAARRTEAFGSWAIFSLIDQLRKLTSFLLQKYFGYGPLDALHKPI